MLRLLIVALPVVVALLVAFDEQEANALRFEVQSPLQFAWRCHASAGHGSITSPHDASQPALRDLGESRSSSCHGLCIPAPLLHLHLHRTHHALTSPPALAARMPSKARAPADTFLVPARSPRKTRPTSFMRTTTPRSPPAKAPRTMSRLRCAQSLHECGQKAPSSQSVFLARGTRAATVRHVRPCLHPVRGMSTPRSRALRMI